MAKIYLDKGHGGTDPGAVGNGLQEKVLTHKIVEYAKSYLLANYEGIEVRTSRAGDETKSLSQRTQDANAWGADFLISVHINSAASSGNGFESFVYTSPSAASVSAQNIIHAEIMAVMKAWGITNDRGKKRANFHMVRESKMAAMLTENLFISHTGDANRLKDEAFLKAIGEAHARGAAKYLGLKTKQAPTPQTQGIGTLYILEDTVIRKQSVYTADITGTVKPGEAYIVHDFNNGWFNIGGWVYAKHVQFIPHNNVKITR